MVTRGLDLARLRGGVTGAARAMGLEISKFLSQLGAEVWMLDINGDAAEDAAQVVRSEGGRARGLRCDVSTTSDLTRLVEELSVGGAEVDFLVNNAAIYAE